MSRWSSAMTYKFVKEYKSNECLWNNNSPHYRLPSMRMKAFQALANCMGIRGFGVPEVKIKIKNLRSTYSQEIRKIKESKKTATSKDHVYVPQVTWFPEMYSILKTYKRIRYPRVDGYDDGTRESSPMEDGFIDSILESNASENSAKTEQQAEIEIEENISNSEEYEPAETLEDLEDTINEESQRNTDLPGKTEPPIKKFLQLKHKRKRSHVSEYERPIEKSLFSEVSQSNEVGQTTQRKDNEFEIFGKHIAAQLSKLSTREAIMVQHKIQGILTESRLGELSPY